MVNRPKVSVITFVYANATNGRAELLVECLDSVKSQGLNDYEHLIIDDGSDIDLASIVDAYPMAKLITKRGTGILSSTYTFNLGHQLAEGDYCIYLPSDDLHMPGALKGLSDALDQHDDLMMVIGNAVYEYENNRTHKWVPSKSDITERMSAGNYVNGCAVMWRRNSGLLDDLPPNYTGFCSDYDFWCTIIRLGKVGFSDVDVVKYRLADDSTRHKTRKKLITSPRSADKIYYQYSKPSRIEMVKDRFVYAPHLRSSSNVSKSVLELDEGVVASKGITLFKKRDWVNLHNFLLKNLDGYQEIFDVSLSDINSGADVLTVNVNSVATISLMHALKDRVNFRIVCEGLSNGWVFDYMPIPFLTDVITPSFDSNVEQMRYLGL